MSSGAATNRLGDETSPYLLQHASNPVDWYPWGPEALGRARAEGRPIFLSIGYSACHWCHVMERESFEDPRIAELMNRHFVNVKVDREERPDLDEIYMKAVISMTGSGGWPMSVFLTPELEPFYGGTYFPPFRSHGRPGFADVLDGVARSWEQNRERVASVAGRLAREIADEGRVDAREALAPDVLDRSLEMLRRSFDPRWGGFGDAPKFPHATDLRLCLRHHLRGEAEGALQMAAFSLEKMAAGGIHDHLGGGFHRYSTDERWLVPHFEKMLYDNALLVPAYLEASLATGREDFARVARGCCDWVLREMVTPEGGFASSQDADSEGEEGLFFAWTPDELAQVLGARRGLWAQECFGVEDDGNFEHGRSVLWRPEPAERVAARLGTGAAELVSGMEEIRAELFEARGRRPRPATDDKVLASWNGLMTSALAMGHQVLEEPHYLDAARRAARWVLQGMRRPDGRLFATARAGRAHVEAGLDDYAFTIQALLDLYESDFDPRWVREALDLNEVLERDFIDAEHGGYYTTGAQHERLIARLKSPHDGALPSGNGVQALNLLRLAELTGRGDLARRAEQVILAQGQLVNRHPAAFSQLLQAVDLLQSGPREVVIAGERGHPVVERMLAAVRGTFLPQRVVALASEEADTDLLPLLADRPAGPDGARAYVCRNWSCREPVDDPRDLLAELED